MTNREKFIEKAKSIWNGEYDYSKVDYVNARTKVEVIHKKCGRSFFVTPNNHTNKTYPRGCSHCRNENIRNTMQERYGKTKEKEAKVKERKDNFIRRAILKWGDEYDYSLVEYKNDCTKVTIKHNYCGHTFEMTPNNHTNKTHAKGCPYCRHKSGKYTIDEVKDKIHSMFGDMYDTSLIVTYNGRNDYLPLICKKHGYFEKRFSRLICGGGCDACHKDKSIKAMTKPFETMVEEAIAIHGNKYEYDENTYVNAHTKMKIACKKCRYIFYQSPHKHLSAKHGCPHCAKDKGGEALTNEEVLQRIKNKFADKYDYSKFVYKNASTPFILICPIHGEFESYLRYISKDTYRGCPKCQQTLLEKEVENKLKDNNINYLYVARKRDGLNWLGRFTLDYYLPEYNIAIECQGEQHYEPVKKFGGKPKFDKIIERDIKKKQLCEENGVRLLYYTHYSKIEEGGNIYKNIESLSNEFQSIRNIARCSK